MRTSFLAIAISTMALLSAGCDPEAPVQSSDVAAEIDGKIAVHAVDTTTHTNLVIPAANVSGEFDSDQIAAGAIGNSELDVSSVGSEEIADGTIALADMGAGSVGASQLVALSVDGSKLAPGSIGPSHLALNSIVGGAAGPIMDGTITGADIMGNSIGGAQILDNAIASADITDNSVASVDVLLDSLGAVDLAPDSVGASELANNAVDTNAIVALAVDDTKLAADSVTMTKILNLAVDSTKLAALAVTQAKIDSDFVGRRLDATGGAGAALNAVFVFTEPAGGAAIDITVVGACESTEPGSIVRLGDQSAACPDVGNNNPIDGTPVLFRLVFNATNENVTFSYDAGADNNTVAWEIYSFTVSGPP